MSATAKPVGDELAPNRPAPGEPLRRLRCHGLAIAQAHHRLAELAGHDARERSAPIAPSTTWTAERSSTAAAAIGATPPWAPRSAASLASQKRSSRRSYTIA